MVADPATQLVQLAAVQAGSKVLALQGGGRDAADTAHSFQQQLLACFQAAQQTRTHTQCDKSGDVVRQIAVVSNKDQACRLLGVGAFGTAAAVTVTDANITT